MPGGPGNPRLPGKPGPPGEPFKCCRRLVILSVNGGRYQIDHINTLLISKQKCITNLYPYRIKKIQIHKMVKLPGGPANPGNPAPPGKPGFPGKPNGPVNPWGPGNPAPPGSP